MLFSLRDFAYRKGILETEWKKRTILPVPRSSPPPPAPQKVHAMVLDPAPPSKPPATPAPSDPNSPARQSSVDVDLDVGGMSPDPDGPGDDMTTMERDVGSEEIVRQLEKGCPRWMGFGKSGWMAEIEPVRPISQIMTVSDSVSRHRNDIWTFCTPSRATRI